MDKSKGKENVPIQRTFPYHLFAENFVKVNVCSAKASRKPEQTLKTIATASLSFIISSISFTSSSAICERCKKLRCACIISMFYACG